MTGVISDFGRLVRRILRLVRVVSYSVIGVMVFLLVFRVIDIAESLATVHPLLGWAFVLVLLLALAIFVGRPIARYLHVPVVMRPPRLPPPEDRTPSHLVEHLAFVETYVLALLENPEWTGEPGDVERVAERCRRLSAEAARSTRADLPALAVRTAELERDDVGGLLAPLDRKAADAIRAEAFKIGVATAASPYGTLDAFFVLWRNVNLVTRITRIYYGRPGTRGSLGVLRDVSLATVAGAYLQDLAEIAGEMLASLVGKTAGFMTGPLMEGCLNAVATLRVGYVAKGRCRAFQAWNERTAADAARDALVEAGHLSAGLVRDVVRTVGGGIMKIPARALSGLVDRLSGLFRKREGPAPEGAPAGG